MFVSRFLSRVSRSVCQSYKVLYASQSSPHLPTLTNYFHSLVLQSANKLIPVQVKLLHLTINSSSTPITLLFSSASPEFYDKEHGSNGTSTGAESSGQAEGAEQNTEPENLEKFAIENLVKSFLDVADNLVRASSISKHKFTKIDASKESNGTVLLLKTLLEKVEMTEKEFAEVFEKFGVEKSDSEHEPYDPNRHDAVLQFQNFGKSLLDVADNLGRASSVVKENLLKIDASKESNEAVPLLETLLEGVEMTEKQLAEALKNVGIEKFNSKHELYNPDRHDAILQFQVSSQPPGTIVAVLKAGYVFYDRVIRRAEVAITRAVENKETGKVSESEG